jgi:flavin reductase (DIM6/NTAB) family NADH-FMN oxidoreductase RutF
MNATSAPYPRGINEMREAGLDPAPCVLVRPPRVKASPCALECRWLQTVRLRDIDGAEVDAHVAFGQVVGVHIDDRFSKGGLLDTAAMRPIARGGYHDYFIATSEARFSLRRPNAGGAADLDDIVIVGDRASPDRT